MAISNTAMADDANKSRFNPASLAGAALAGAQVVDAVGDRASKVIDPENSVIGSFDVRQRLNVNDIYIKRGLVRTNRVRTSDINAGSVSVRQDTRIENVNVIDGLLEVNDVNLNGSTYGRVNIKQDAVIRNVIIEQGALIGNIVNGQ